MSQPPHISDDGMWRWDGERWVPNTGGRPPTAPPKKEHRALWITLASVASGIALIILIIAVAAGGGSNSKSSSSAKPAASQPAKPTAQPKPAAPACTQPCIVTNGVTVSVSAINYGAEGGSFHHPEAGNVFVTMNVTMANSAGQEAHFNPFNFVLQDGSGVKHTTTFTDACPTFSAVNVAKGGTATKCVAFEATANQPAGLTLVWTPGFGDDHNIKLS